MRKKLTEPFGKAGLTVAIVALVMALVGGAYAAGGLTKSQEKQVTKIAKKFAGKPGAAGAAGASGPAGAAGSAGAKGDTGSVGGTGPAGKSVVIGATAPSCTSGGKTIEVAGEPATKQNVCNGEPGVLHPGETLPPGATETGSWSFGPTNEKLVGKFVSVPTVVVPIATFAIPLAAPLNNEPGCGEPGEPECQVHYVKVGETPPPGCEGGTAAEPTAEPGNFCVYASLEEPGRVTPGFIVNPGTGLSQIGTGTTGAVQLFELKSTNDTTVIGTWAVTEKE